jgi:hypothetical protein
MRMETEVAVLEAEEAADRADVLIVVSQTLEYRISYEGLVDKWTVTRLVDGRQMARDLPSREEVRSRVSQFEQTTIASNIVGRL